MEHGYSNMNKAAPTQVIDLPKSPAKFLEVGGITSNSEQL